MAAAHDAGGAQGAAQTRLGQNSERQNAFATFGQDTVFDVSHFDVVTL